MISYLKALLRDVNKQKQLHMMVIPGIIFLIIFSYIPMYGIIISFKNYSVLDTISTAPWVGLDNFKEFLADEMFWRSVRNTVLISITKIIVGFPLPIILALLINELYNKTFKRFVQTVSYLPHFFSWVILGGMVIMWLSEEGFINNLLCWLGVIDHNIPFLIYPKNYLWIATFSSIWKDVGWNTIIYLAAITGIDPTLYEAAKIDGANKIQQILHITIPCIKGIIILLLILSVSGILGANFDQTLVLQNPLNVATSEVIDSYVYKIGLGGGNFSYATAIGLLRSVISLGLLLSANYFTRKLNDRTIF